MPNHLKRGALIISLIFVAFIFLEGCSAGYYMNYTPVTVSQVEQMSKEGKTAEYMIDKMKESRTVYRLKADQLAKLEQDGVPAKVINYMQKTYLNAVRQNQALEDWGYWWPGGDGYWYGGPAFGWPYDQWGWYWDDDI